MRATPQWSIRAHGDNMEITGAICHNEKWKNDLLFTRMVDDESDHDSEIDCHINVSGMLELFKLIDALRKTSADLSISVLIDHTYGGVWAFLGDTLCDTNKCADISIRSDARNSAIELAAVEAVKLLNGAMHKNDDI